MKYVAKVEVRLKPSLSDPEGEATAKSLIDLRFKVSGVKVAKVYEIIFQNNSLEGAKDQAEEMCRRLLANPVRDDYHYSVVEFE